MKLEDIGFYTLSDWRAKNSSHTSPLWRCELILTDECNFRCKYCRGLRSDCSGTMPLDRAYYVLDSWIKDGLRNVRFSGGEPTMYTGLKDLVSHCKTNGVEHIAISTNGSAHISKYMDLVNRGANDFSISLDACCSSFADKMSGRLNVFNNIVTSIKSLSKVAYVTVGVVVTSDNYSELNKIIRFAHELGVADIRIISSAQENFLLEEAGKVEKYILDSHPILNYRIKNILNGRGVRGMSKTDCHKCYLMLDDMAIAGQYHFPCIIYMREGGDPVGNIYGNIREDRLKWFNKTDCYEEPICRSNCLDVCVDMLNRARDLRCL
jgi:MoaA/NifB/PqqE/SkfB family radical SAM enzyme